ncbi:purple acid phosphatase family protein [Catenulispora pinisilvae]|uniref:purple acid phosphatase family protein n=1 Tax=Catenulispora pinisilvae TaxID=2705253 RepID=UPI0018912113|nr:metallophosphoesterase family protein [Catenulispora pinisilvae]
MTDRMPVDRRTALLAAGTAGAALAASPLLASPAAAAATTEASPEAASGPTSAPAPSGSPLLLTTPGALGAPPVDGLHLTFGADPTREMYASWTTTTPVQRPRVRFGSVEGGHGNTVQAETRTYTDGASGREVYVHHAHIGGLRPDSTYVYSALHDGVLPDSAAFRTAPSGRKPFTFTSFGDQATPGTTWAAASGGGFTSVPATIATPAAADIVAGVEQVAPLFHLLNGDLCYANINPDRLRTWDSFFQNNTRSARFRPWMPAAGNHENEKGNGPLGFSAFQTRFALPANGEDAEFAGLWYAFTVGSVRFVVLQNDDVALQDGGDTYVSGYSAGRQRAWLERTLKAARRDDRIDWIVVCMHQVIVSSSDANGADVGIREQWGPLFDKYEVDLVVCGHEHDYERSHPVRGVISGSETLTPNPVSTDTNQIDTSKGTVHMVLGGGGTSSPSNQKFFAGSKAKVLMGVGAPVNGKKTPTYVFEDAPWIGVRDEQHPYGFAAFDVDPGTHAGGQTRIHVTYYVVSQPDGKIAPLETFTLSRMRSDG